MNDDAVSTFRERRSLSGNGSEMTRKLLLVAQSCFNPAVVAMATVFRTSQQKRFEQT